MDGTVAEELRFFVPGPPRPWQRVLVNPKTRVMFTAPETRAYQVTVKTEALAAAARSGWRPRGEDSIGVSLWIRFLDARRRDLDNVCKTILDAMNTIVYLDDSQVDEIHLYREASGERSGVVVCVRRRPR